MFLLHLWKHLGLPPPTKAQLDIAYWLQHGPNRAILQAFRGVGKSWITVGFVAWSLLLDPEKKILVVSAGEQLAGDFTKFLLQIIREMPVLQHLEPRKDQRCSSVSFDVGPAKAAKDPSVKSVGITGQMTGSRADIIIADDVELLKNSFTHLLREKLSGQVKEFDSILRPKKEARIIYLGTPQIEDSLYVRLSRDRGYTTRIWPAEVPASLDTYGHRLAPMVTKMVTDGVPTGTPVDPARFSKEDLDNRKLSLGRGDYSLQFMLDTNPSDTERHPLKLKDLIVTDVDPDVAPVKLVWSADRAQTIQDLGSGGFDGDHYQKAAWVSEERGKYALTVMAIDPSGKGTDETAYCILKVLHGYLYLVDVGGFVDGYGEETLETLAGKASRWGVNKIVIEKNYGGGMFNQLLRPYLQKVGRDVIDDEWNAWSSSNKEQRIIDTLKPVITNHKLVVDRKVLEDDLKTLKDNPKYSFIYQMTRMAKVKGVLAHDDRIETLSMAVSYNTERMARDSDKALKKHKDEALAKELKKFVAHATGRKEQRLRYN